MKTSILLIATLAPLITAEPAPRAIEGTALPINASIKAVASVHELRDGRLLISDPDAPAVYLVETSGKATKLGSVGSGEGRYARPGGFYRGVADTVLLVDRGQTRAIAITPRGELGRSRSIAERGTMTSSPDEDLQRLDRAGMVYMLGRNRGDAVADSNYVLRLNPVTQRIDTLARLLKPLQRTVQTSANSTMTRATIGSPADGWGVAFDGRVVVVRAVPYRVEWHAPDGTVVRGPVIQYDVLPMTEEDRKEWAEHRPDVGTGRLGSRSASNDTPDLFASVKPAFDASQVIVAPDGRVWVKRSAPARSTRAVWDVFDARGNRVDRISIPAAARVVGVGAGNLYATMGDGRSITRYAL